MRHPLATILVIHLVSHHCYVYAVNMETVACLSKQLGSLESLRVSKTDRTLTACKNSTVNMVILFSRVFFFILSVIKANKVPFSSVAGLFVG